MNIQFFIIAVPFLSEAIAQDVKLNIIYVQPALRALSLTMIKGSVPVDGDPTAISAG